LNIKPLPDEAIPLIAAYSPLDTVIWYYEELACPEVNQVLMERLPKELRFKDWTEEKQQETSLRTRTCFLSLFELFLCPPHFKSLKNWLQLFFNQSQIRKQRRI